MTNEKPFIHPIKTPYGSYIFDVNTNSVIKVKEEVFKAIKDGRTDVFDENDVKNEIEVTIRNLKEEGLLSSKRPKKIVHPEDRFLEYSLGHKVKKITLQVTQKCNFRCAYCVYSETANGKQRTHSLKSMSFETAKKGIDFLLDHSRDLEEVNIGFYGGEPLLEFELIKKSVEYAEDLFEGKDLSFTITTNGSLLTDKIIDFLIEHDIHTMISLDGPKEIQDKNRIFAANGCGTFDVVERNLLKIREKYPEYFKKLSFSMVLDPSNDFDCINSLFTDYDLFKENNIMSTVIDDAYSNRKIHLEEDFISKRGYEVFKAYLHYFGELDKDAVSPIAMKEVDEVKQLKDKLSKGTVMSEVMSHGGPCIPGAQRLFINAEGNFYPCERVSELSEVMGIGNIEDGFDIEKSRNLLNVAKLTGDSCKNCWAISHCVMCAKQADNSKELSVELKKNSCSSVRNYVESLLRNYLMVSEVQEVFLKD
ncbi:Cys-rich peptide radical SAM maturase CcpM [Clostridium zeae]|uniref:Cys-rich peptide radical SAM maturase CcpM n=1 Tax=Clostridium zeae TaxID=2759022 RepID=A0ABQ1EES2_9CLOT|nr:Cys-rich peptide radical SAM maturase CcpM [Clostridium zeae]GFZ33317.1 Cys-rich peptide radical SAM maturase CcpM [Clostridium zeae]